jgi:hypothetical protein
MPSEACTLSQLLEFAIARVHNSETLGLVPIESGNHSSERVFDVAIRGLHSGLEDSALSDSGWTAPATRGGLECHFHIWEACSSLKIRQHCAEPRLRFAIAFFPLFLAR